MIKPFNLILLTLLVGLSLTVKTHAESSELMAGDLINTDKFLCTTAFHGSFGDEQDYIVTAGHCLIDAHPFWKLHGENIGTSTQQKTEDWKGHDVGLIHSNDNKHITKSNMVRISESETLELTSYQNKIKDLKHGTKICMVGAISGHQCGLVKFKLPFISYIWTTIKPLEGDSGGPVFLELENGKGELLGIVSGHILGNMYFSHISKVLEVNEGFEPYLGEQ